MRVIHIDTGKEWRGGQSQVLMLAEGTRQRGHDVVLAARKGGALAERAAQVQLRCHEVTFRFEIDPGSALSVSRLAATNGTPSLYHAHTPHALGLAILAQKLGPSHPIVFTRRVAFPIKKFFVNRWKLNRADRIVAVSGAVSATLLEAGIPDEKIRVIHSAIDTRDFRYTGPNVASPLNIVIAGAVEQAKGIEAAMDCVEKAERLPVRFHFIGTGRDLEALKKWASGRNNVEVHGFVRDVANFLPRMFGAVTFSPSEGFPNGVLQAMAVGLPVLAFENDAVREILESKDLGKLFRTPDEALAGIADWVSNKDAFAEKARLASEWVLAHYSQDLMVDRTLNLYKEILA